MIVENNESHALAHEIEDFIYFECELLADREYRRWLDILHDEISYRMFIVRSVSPRTGQSLYLESPLDIAWFDEGKDLIEKRVQQLETGVHWAENPPSRTTRFVSNMRIHAVRGDDSGPEEAHIRYNFMINRHRNDHEEDNLCGKKLDILVRGAQGWLVKSRRIYVNQPTITMGSLSFFV